MGICYYLISREKREAFDLDKGWCDLADILTGEAPMREAFDAAVLRAWCGWAILTPAEYEDRLLWPVLGATRRERELKIAERFVLHAAGYYVLKHTGLEPFDFDRELAYVVGVSEKLWVFCERYTWKVDLINDAGDPPWWDEDGWVCVGSRFDTTKVPFRLSNSRYGYA